MLAMGQPDVAPSAEVTTPAGPSALQSLATGVKREAYVAKDPRNYRIGEDGRLYYACRTCMVGQVVWHLDPVEQL